MYHLISVTLIPISGVNKLLEKDIFLGNFIDKAEEALDTLPVGCAIEILYDHAVTDSNGDIIKVKPMQCVVKQTSRGVFSKVITNAPLCTDLQSLNKRRAELRKLKRVFMNKVAQ